MWRLYAILHVCNLSFLSLDIPYLPNELCWFQFLLCRCLDVTGGYRETESGIEIGPELQNCVYQFCSYKHRRPKRHLLYSFDWTANTDSSSAGKSRNLLLSMIKLLRHFLSFPLNIFMLRIKFSQTLLPFVLSLLAMVYYFKPFDFCPMSLSLILRGVGKIRATEDCAWLCAQWSFPESLSV